MSDPDGSLLDVAYRERLVVPLRWWVQATMFLATIWLAFIVSCPPWLAWTSTAGCCLVAYSLLAYVGKVRIEVSSTQLRAGRAHIPLDLLGAVGHLDREETTTALGTGADARAWLVTRPYIRESVKVAINDPADPTPYWLISTRHPHRLCRVLSARGVSNGVNSRAASAGTEESTTPKG